MMLHETTRLTEAFEAGGWGMYPVLVFGLVLVGTSVWYAVRPEGRLVPLAVSMGILTLLSGMLGFVMGVINTLRYVAGQPKAPDSIVLVGVGESLNDLALAFVLMTLSTLIAAVGAFRLARRAAGVATVRA